MGVSFDEGFEHGLKDALGLGEALAIKEDGTDDGLKDVTKDLQTVLV